MLFFWFVFESSAYESPSQYESSAYEYEGYDQNNGVVESNAYGSNNNGDAPNNADNNDYNSNVDNIADASISNDQYGDATDPHQVGDPNMQDGTHDVIVEDVVLEDGDGQDVDVQGD